MARWIERGLYFPLPLRDPPPALGLPPCALLERAGWPHELVQPGPLAYAGFAGIVLSAVLTAFGFSLVTERQTGRIRRFLLRGRPTATPLAETA